MKEEESYCPYFKLSNLKMTFAQARLTQEMEHVTQGESFRYVGLFRLAMGIGQLQN